MKINLANSFFEKDLSAIKEEILSADRLLKSRQGKGNEFLGWIDLPVNYDKEEFARIKKAADKIRKDSDVLVAIGIGGSDLGAKAAMDALLNSYEKTFELIEYLKDKDF